MFGRVLFFTSPPVETEKKGTALGHRAKYLAWKAERESLLREKRKRTAEVPQTQQAKRAKSEELERQMAKTKLATLEKMNDVLAEGTIAEYRTAFGDKWQEALDKDLIALEKGQDAVLRSERERGAVEEEREKRERMELEIRGLGVKGGALEFGIRT
jgi:chromatin structure-remodeling complex subunit RSC1/2